MEINSTHGEFYVRAGGDEKLKNYFAWPNSVLMSFLYVDVFLVGGYVLHFPRTLAPPYSSQTSRRRPSPLGCWILQACVMSVLY